MIKIDKLNIDLPSEFRHRATAIAHLLGQKLSRENIRHTGRISLIAAKTIDVNSKSSNEEIASKLVRSICRSIENHGGMNG